MQVKHGCFWIFFNISSQLTINFALPDEHTQWTHLVRYILPELLKKKIFTLCGIKKKNQTKFLYTPKSVSSFEDMSALLGHILKVVEDLDKS